MADQAVEYALRWVKRCREDLETDAVFMHCLQLANKARDGQARLQALVEA